MSTSSRMYGSLALIFWMSACERTPSKVNTQDLEAAAVTGKMKTLCRGLEMRDDDVRRYAAEKLDMVTEPIAAECICTTLTAGPGAEKLGWDPAIVEGLKRTSRDDLAGCVVAVAKRSDLKERLRAVSTMTSMTAPVARQALIDIAVEAGAETDVRLSALNAVAGAPATKAQVLGLLASDAEPTVRRAAATGLGALVEPDVTAALLKAAAEDADGAVRGAALLGVKRHGVAEADAMLCTAMQNDESAAVRAVAIGAFKGTKRPEGVECLRKAAMVEQPDAEVRAKLLMVLKSSPTPEAAKVLCDAIPFWVKTYLKEGMVDKVPSSDIIRAQNDRDWDKSLACVEAAQRQAGGYSCYGKKYVASWVKELGGNSFEPKCPGYNE